MTLGQLKLKYRGKEDQILIGNPKISFWKYIYKAHTNFAKQSNTHECLQKKYMSNECSTKFRFRILRNAELVSFITLRLNLPKIYSHVGDLGEFAWIRNIGASIIESAKLYFDDILIEEIDGDFLITHRDLYLNSDKSANFNKLIGHVPALHSPYVHGRYPGYTTSNVQLGNVLNLKRGFKTGVSINNYELNIPLLFCFFREKSHIPLVSNRFREVFIEITLRPLKDLYTIIKRTPIVLDLPSEPTKAFLQEAAPTTAEILIDFPSNSLSLNNSTNPSIENTITHDRRIPDPEPDILKFTHNLSLSYFVPTLDVEYVFLDNVERREFALQPLSQIFTFNKKISFTGITGKHNKLYIKEYHAIKSLHIISKKDNVHTTNQWSNYSNQDYENQEVKYLQNNFTTLAENEAKSQGKNDFIKFLGAFLQKNDQPTCLIAKSRFTIAGGQLLSVQGLDFLTSKPTLILNGFNSGTPLNYNLAVRFVIVVHPGVNYIKGVRVVTEGGVVLDATVNIDHGSIKNVVLAQKRISTDYERLYIQSQLYCSGLQIVRSGKNYKTQPYIIAVDGDDHIRLTHSTELLNKHLNTCVLDHGTIVHQKGEVFVGGILRSIKGSPGSIIPNDTHIEFYDPYNKIVQPKLTISNNRIMIDQPGAGLTRHTTISTGRHLNQIQLPDDLRITSNIFDYNIVPIHSSKYRDQLVDGIVCGKKPILEFNYKALNTPPLRKKLYFNETFIFPTDSVRINENLINNKVTITIISKKLPAVALQRNIYLTFNSKHHPISLNIGAYKPVFEIPIRIICNLQNDVTECFSKIKLQDISFSGNYTKQLVIYSRQPFAVTGIREGDRLSLFIGGHEFSTVTVMVLKKYPIGLSKPHLDFVELNTYKDTLLFGDFQDAVPIIAELGKSLRYISAEGFDFKQNNLLLTNNCDYQLDINGEELQFRETHINSAVTDIEYDFGGGNDSLQPFVDVQTFNGRVQSIYFNSKYHSSKKYWRGYRKRPMFFIKNGPAHTRRNAARKELSRMAGGILEDILDADQNDAIIKGILDYGGCDFKGVVVNKNPGIGGEIGITKTGSDDVYTFDFKNAGYNYDRGLICTLIGYNIKSGVLDNLHIVEQFTAAITDLGQIDIRANALLKNGTSISEFQIIWELDSGNDHSKNYIFNPSHNQHTQYAVIIGHIPDTTICIINRGGGYSTEATALMLNMVSTKPLLFDAVTKYELSIHVGEIEKLTMAPAKQDHFDIPVIGYTITKGVLCLKETECSIEPFRQLTGFEIVEGGSNLQPGCVIYNGFMTNLSKLDTSKHDLYLDCDTVETSLITDQGTISLKDEHKFAVINTKIRDQYNALDYTNVRFIKKQSDKLAAHSLISEVQHTIISRQSVNILDIPETSQETFTQFSCLEFSTKIDSVDIIHHGNELTDLCQQYKIILLNAVGELINPPSTIIADLIGSNARPLETSIEIVVEGDGGGCGGIIKPLYTKSHGCKLLPIMKINEWESTSNALPPIYMLSGTGTDSIDEACICVENEYVPPPAPAAPQQTAPPSQTTPIAPVSQPPPPPPPPPPSGLVGIHSLVNLDISGEADVYPWNTVSRSRIITTQDAFSISDIDQFMNVWRYRLPGDIPILNGANYEFYTATNGIIEFGLHVDFKERERSRNINYYKYLEKYLTAKNAVASDILLYSFCLDNDLLQPNGSVNLSSLDNICVDLEMYNPYKDSGGRENYKYNVDIFLRYYNSIEYINGKGSLRFGN